MRSLRFPAVSQRKVRDVLDRGLASIELASEAGIPLGFGTDRLGETHEHQSDELTIRAEAQSPADVLRSATLVNAEILGREGELGVVEAGALADLLLVDGDPLRDLSCLQEQGKHLDFVLKNGEAVSER